MAILEQVKIEPTNGARNNRPFSGFAQERPRAKVWANWSIMIGGEPVPLPLGQAIDTMEPASTTGQNVGVVKLNHQKNNALAALQALGADMKPGETMIVGDASKDGNVVCRLFRVNDELEIPKTDSDLDVNGIVTLLQPKKVETEKPSADKAALQAQLELLQKQLNG